MKKSCVRATFWITLFATTTLLGCGGGATPDTKNKAPNIALVSINITPSTPEIVQGATQQFAATGTYSDNSSSDITASVTWNSSNPTKASVSNAGLATGNGTGESTISAAYKGETGSAVLKVTSTPVAPLVTTQPANKSVLVGEAANFSVIASGTSPFSYQWRKNGTNLVGANSSSYTTPTTVSGDNGAKFSVVISNTAGNITSNDATLTVTATPVAPTIITHPANTSVTAGQTATFTVAASGTSPFTYQWRKNGANITSATSASYTTPATVLANNGAKFSVVVSNASGTNVTSNEATLSVTAAASSSYVADYSVATDAALRAIPDSYIDTARTTSHVAYFHTSHGTHVTYGVFGLPSFKSGDTTKFGVTYNTTADANKLDFQDNYGPDLSQADTNWTAWRDQVRTYLDDPANAVINVMMWSWCDITGHNVSSYLSSMQTLINEYGAGGSKIGTGTGKTRTTPVTFIFMTGHANPGANTGTGNPRDQAALITNYCNTHGYFCIDYYSIDTHTMDGVYYEDTGDNGNSLTYGGNFYQDWQDSHTKKVDWYENLYSPGGSSTYGVHNTQHITANRKAFAFWWVLARIAGY